MDWRNWFKSEKNLNTARPVNTNNSGTWKTIQEPFTGAWERNQELQLTDSLSSYAVFSCISLISKDVGKLPVIARTEENGIKTNITLVFSPLQAILVANSQVAVAARDRQA